MTNPTISIIIPPKVGSDIQLAVTEGDIYLGPLVLEQALRNHGFNQINNYDLSREFTGKMSMILDYDRSPNFEDQLYGHQDVEDCVKSCADKIDDSDLYLISIHLANHTPGLKLAQRLKQDHLEGKRKKKGYTFVGGVTVAETTERILAINEIDAACYGYAEDVVVQIAHFAKASITQNIETYELSVIPNLYIRDKEGRYIVTDFVLPSNFVSIPQSLLQREASKVGATRLSVVGAYGCPWCSCNYCYLSSKPKHYYKRDMESIIEDMEAVARVNGVKKNDMLDEFFLHRTDKFLAASNNARFAPALFVNARPDHVIKFQDGLERLIQGYRGEQVRVYMGAENFNEEFLSKLNRGITAKQTREATLILRRLASKYKDRFGFALGFFLWANCQTAEGLLKSIRTWEEFTGGELSPADLLKIQRYNIFTNPNFAEKTRHEFDNEMSSEEQKLAVMYPYGRAIFHPPLEDLNQKFVIEIFPKMPLPPHEMQEFLKLVPSSIMDNLSGYGRRLVRFPYETVLRLHLKNASQKVINTVLGDINEVAEGILTGMISSATHKRIYTKEGNRFLQYI